MHHDRIQSPLRPLNIDFTTTAQFDTRSAPLSGDPGSGISQLTVPGGATVTVKDSTGTSLALNLGIHPVHGTPLLSGQAITAQGDVLEVHPCSCKDPIASRHNLPTRGTPDLSRSRLLFRDNDPYPSPNSLPPIHHTPGPSRDRSPLILIQTQMPSPYATELLQELEIPPPAPETDGGPITPTPASVRRTTSSSTGATYHTTPEYLEDLSASPQQHVDSSPSSSSSQRDVPPKLDPIPTQSAFVPDFDLPTASSISSISPFSGISEPSAIGPFLSLPTAYSDSTSGCSPCTVLAFPRSFTDAQQNQTPTASSFNRPSSRGAAPQDGSGASVAEVNAPSQPEGTVHSANDGTAGTRDVPMTTGVASDQPLDRDHVNPPPSEGSKTGSTSDLYTDRPGVRVPMPTARIGSDGEALQYDLTAQLEPGPSMTELGGSSSRNAPLHGEIKGTWIANQERDHVALKLDLTLLKLGLQNQNQTFFSSPGLGAGAGAGFPGPSSSAQRPRPCPPRAVEDDDADDDDDADSSSSRSMIESLGSCPSTAPTLSDLPLTPIPELTRTPTKYNTSFTDALPFSHTQAGAAAHPGEKKRHHLVSRLPAPLDNGPIVAQLVQGESDIRTIQTTLHHLANEWQGVVIMPDGIALRDVEDDCTALYHSLVDLTPIIMLTWPPMRQPSLGTEGGQPPAHEQQLHLEHMGETGHKWYLKQHEFTTSLQRNLSRLTLLARRVVEDPDATYRGNVLERISQFTEKFEDLALRFKLAHHIRVEQKCRARVRHAARRAVASPEQVSAYEYHKANLAKVRQDIEKIARDASRRHPWR